MDRAASVSDHRGVDALRDYVGTLGLVVSVLVAAFLVHRFAPGKRQHVRQMVLFLGLHFVFAAAALFMQRIGAAATWPNAARLVSELFAAFSVVGIAGIVVFDVALPALRVDLATIVSDLGIGVAYLVAILTVLRRAGVDFTGIVATSAVVTGILALGMQATLGNVLGGVALQLDRSIRVGDWLQLDGGRQGRVREIRWRHTVVETRDWDTLIVPNASLLAATIMILGKRTGEPLQHRMAVHFNVDFRHTPSDVVRAVNEALRGAPMEGVAAEPAPVCFCQELAGAGRDSFAHYAVWYWLTDLARDETTSSRVRERVVAALRRADIPLAVPAAQLWVEQDTLERRERKEGRERKQRASALRSVDFLRPLTEAELSEVVARLQSAPFVAGERIMAEGSVAHWLYILVGGEVEVRVDAPEGGHRVVATLGAPSVFGEMGLMTGEPRSATVVALTDVECFRLDKEAFHAILSARPEVAAEISGLLAQRRVELHAARDHLDAATKQRRVDAEKKKILSTIQLFFGLGS